MRSKYILMSIVSAALTIGAANVSHAQSLIEEDYDGDQPRVTTPWYEFYSEENYKADKDYIVGMRPHHAGALTMSQEYLESPESSSERLQALSHGIIRNQTFEIMMLDTVEDKIKDIDFSNGPVWRQVAERGLAVRDRFIRSPMPAVQNSFSDEDVVSAEDVRFAKAMIVHHEGALMMAKDYLDNPHGRNGYLERLNLDVLRDQKQEIQLMKNIIAAYPGNPDDVKIDPSMIHGMDGMMHHMNMDMGKKENGHSHHH